MKKRNTAACSCQKKEANKPISKHEGSQANPRADTKSRAIIEEADFVYITPTIATKNWNKINEISKLKHYICLQIKYTLYLLPFKLSLKTAVMVTSQCLKRCRARLVPFAYNCMHQKSEPAYLELHMVFYFQNDINGRLFEVAY